MTTKARQGLARFITTEAIAPNNDAGYQKVWDAVREAFSPSRESSIGYWRYPLFLQVGNRRKEPDILIVDQQWGIIVIEVCPVNIEQITSVNDNYIQFYDNTLQQNYYLENIFQYAAVLRKYCDQEPIKTPESDIQQKIIGRTLIAFPNISTKEWQEKGWTGTEEGTPFIFNNQLGEVGLKNRIEKAQAAITGESLNDSQYKSLLSVISGTSILRKFLEKIESADHQSLYNILVEAQKLMYEWDAEQEYIAKTIPPGPQRVSGIAGSGKTVLFSQKFENYDSREDELLALVEKIKYNLQEDKLNPSRNILIIALGYTTPPSYNGKNLERKIADFLINCGIDIYIPSALSLNNIQPEWPNNNRDLFWFDGGITVSRIDRTKGNEADMVYVVGLDNIAKKESDTKLRNQLFVALTRSRGWVNISGIGNYPFYEEVNKVIAQGNTFTFTLKGVTPLQNANDDLTEEDEQNL